MDKDAKRISKEQDVNYVGQPIYRPTEKASEPVKPRWMWIWIIIIILVVLAWIFLFWYFSNHQAPYAAPV